MNIQDKLQEIHHKYGTTEMANYKIELFIEDLIKKDRDRIHVELVEKGDSLDYRELSYEIDADILWQVCHNKKQK